MKDKKRYDKYYNIHLRYLKNIVRNLFKFSNLPDSIDERALQDFLCFDGYVVGFKYKNDVIVATGALSGLDHYYRPTLYTVANPYLPSLQLAINKECAVCYNTSNYQYPENFNSLLDYTASRLADIDISIDISCRNSRPTLIPVVNDEKEALRVSQTLNTMYEGSPVALAYRTGSFTNNKAIEIFPIKARDNIVVSELADARRSVMADFWSMLGVDTIAVDKKERTNLNEMNSNNTQLKLANEIYFKPRKRWCDEMNKLFNLNITVEFNEADTEVYYYESV